MHPAASVRIRVGKPLPSCLVIRPLVLAPPAVRFCICPGASPRACSCLHMSAPAHVQGRSGQTRLGLGLGLGPGLGLA